MMWEM